MRAGPYLQFSGPYMEWLLIAETMVWPNFFLINVFFALKGSKLFIIIFVSHLGVTAILVMYTRYPEQTFVPYTWRLHMKFNFCKQRVIFIILFNVMDILIKLLWSHVSMPRSRFGEVSSSSGCLEWAALFY